MGLEIECLRHGQTVTAEPAHFAWLRAMCLNAFA